MKLSKDYSLRNVAGENVLVKVRAGSGDLSTFFSMNDPAAWLWDQIRNIEFTEETLVGLLCEEFDVDEETAAKDVAEMVELWRRYGMVVD